jgi:pyrroline-5-carboxylate reductase
MELSLDAGAIALAILIHLVGYGFMLKNLTEQMRKTGEQLDRLIISTERAQAREEAKSQFAVEVMHRRGEG